MDYKGLLGFLLNNGLLSLEDIYDKPFNLEKREESNLLFYVNNRVTSGSSLVVKVLKNPSTSKNLLLREAKFFEFFTSPDTNINRKLLIGFDIFNPNDIKGLYQNNTIFVRKFIGDYRDAFRYLKKYDKTDMNQFIEVIAGRIATFHECLDSNKQASLIKFISDYFAPSEVYHNPIFFKEILPLTKFKFAPPYIQQFWNVINQESSKVINLFDELKNNRDTNGTVKLIHGDFRLKNILFRDKDWKLTLNSFLIDYEQWHLGDIAWDIATFFNTFPKYRTLIPHLSNVVIGKDIFYDAYFKKTTYSSDAQAKIKIRVDCLQKIIKIQNSYANIVQNGQNSDFVNKEIVSIINILQS